MGLFARLPLCLFFVLILTFKYFHFYLKLLLYSPKSRDFRSDFSSGLIFAVALPPSLFISLSWLITERPLSIPNKP